FRECADARTERGAAEGTPPRTAPRRRPLVGRSFHANLQPAHGRPGHGDARGDVVERLEDQRVRAGAHDAVCLAHAERAVVADANALSYAERNRAKTVRDLRTGGGNAPRPHPEDRTYADEDDQARGTHTVSTA